MEEDEKTGGPAFGKFAKVGDLAISDGGLTIRDWFAGQAAKALVSDASFREGGSFLTRDAMRCYRFADAMMAERKR